MKKYVLGIDTSAYTTSIAVVNYSGTMLYNLKKNLEVSTGQRGLRQGTAVFMHMNNLPDLLSKINIDFNEIGIISVSAFPRRTENSYMPVFVVGKNYGNVIAKAISADIIYYSHQENHIASAVMKSYKQYDYVNNDILAVHLSGGTTEFLKARKIEKGFSTEIVGGTKDITFGQLIDRIGVYLGFNFPCGQHMQDYLLKHDVIDSTKIKDTMPRICGDKFINLSGIENFYKRIIDSTMYTKEVIILSLFTYISECTLSVINNICKDLNVEKIIISGGVSANSVIRSKIDHSIGSKYDIIFPENGLSSDNSIGNAMLPLMDRWYYENKAN